MTKKEEKLKKEVEKLKKKIEKLEDDLDTEKRVKKEILKRLNEYEIANLKLFLAKVLGQKKQLPKFVKDRTKQEKKKRNPKSKHKRTSRKNPINWDFEYNLAYDTCPHCSHNKFSIIEEKERFVEDLPQQKDIEVTKYNILRCKCMHCKKIVSPKINDILPYSRFGMRLMLKVAYMKYELRLPYDKIRTYLYDEYSLKITNKTLMDMINSLCKIFACSYKQLRQKIRDSEWVHADESGWNIDGDNAWLWGFFDKNVSVYKIDKSRGRKVVNEVLGHNFSGVLSTDFYNAYNIDNWKQQKCWVHLLRETRNLAKGKYASDEAKKFHKNLKAFYEIITSVTPPEIDILQKKLRKILKKKYKHTKIKTLVERLNKHFYSMFTFLEHGESADNNFAESALRPAVIIRKISYGNRAQRCADSLSIILSHMETWKKQGKNFFEESMKLFNNFMAQPQF